MTESSPVLPKENSRVKKVLETLRWLVPTILLFFFIRFYIFQPLIVSGDSMFPTFKNSEYFLADEVSYRFINPKRGDVIVFHDPCKKSDFRELPCNSGAKIIIKRIVGLPNETVFVDGQNTIIKNAENPDGFTLNEPYLHGISPGIMERPVTLDEDSYFVMGDNRGVSYDSRMWGALEEKYIIGRPLVRLFPPNRLTLFPGTLELTQTE